MAKPPVPASSATPEPDEEELETPWHFKLLLIALVLYLAWRAIQLFVWLFQRFF